MNVKIYDAEHNKLGLTNFIIYAEEQDGKIVFTGYKRFYVEEPDEECSRYMNLDVEDFNFVLTISPGQSDMFQYTNPKGKVIEEEMSRCMGYSEWRTVQVLGAKAELELTTWVEDLEKYYSTEYMVVEV